jgi:hypothetical protein
MRVNATIEEKLNVYDKEVEQVYSFIYQGTTTGVLIYVPKKYCQ